jgi:hypothetical protein
VIVPVATDTRPEDRNARQLWETWSDGATLAELEVFIAVARERGAPDDAHPEVGKNERNEIVSMTCVTQREL